MKMVKGYAAALLVIGALLYAASLSLEAAATPTGATVTNISHDTGPTFTPGNRSDDGGTINTVNLDSTQQNFGWKAYVGNVTGKLTLDDANQNTIYDWTLSTVTGEVYVSRSNSIDWSSGSISCASQATIASEQSFIGGSASDDDSINNTYNYTKHATMQVGVNTIQNSTCRATYTYVNDAFQGASESTNFTAILLEDSGSNLIYATFIEQDATGFDGSTYDFQVIVPDQDNSSIVTYYFYLEIG